MSPETTQQLVELSRLALQILGATSIVGILSFLVAYYAFPPDIVISEVRDSNKSLNSESRILIKNIGQMPAFNIITDVENMNLIFNTNTFNLTSVDCGHAISKLSRSEQTEISIRPGVSMPPKSLTQCKYTLILKYYLKLPFFKKQLKKRWSVELRNYGENFSWHISLL